MYLIQAALLMRTRDTQRNRE